LYFTQFGSAFHHINEKERERERKREKEREREKKREKERETKQKHQYISTQSSNYIQKENGGK